MRDGVGSWLEDLGFGQYADAFVANGIDFELLPDLTNEDLQELGIARLGDRKRLLSAIAELAAARSASKRTTEATPAPPREPERRQLTVLFCDLVGSTELSGTLDPEVLREVLRAYQAACAEVVDRYEGFVAKHMGDGVLVYFGVPRAHEDDAERAVRAAIGIISAVASLGQGLKSRIGADLKARIGVHTGLVVVGDMGTGAAHEEMAIVGETPNVAARLQGVAEPNAIVISADTQRLVGDLFLYEDLGKPQLKGVARSVQVWRVVDERPTESRFKALHGSRVAPLIARDAELELLLQHWEQARSGHGQVVLICGEPGIGKSRLVEGFCERTCEAPRMELRCQCSAYLTNSAFHPIARQLEHAAEIAVTDSPEVRLRKLARHLHVSGQDTPEPVALLARLLSIPAEVCTPVSTSTSQSLKERTIAALLDRVVALAMQRPTLWVIEDAHWLDPSSEELVAFAAERLRGFGVLILLTHRPEYAPAWISRPGLTTLMLNRLSENQSSSLLAGLFAQAALPEDIAGDIIARADGVPLFLEELANAVLEARSACTGEQSRGSLYRAIPATLHDTLVARLDRSEAVKETAQTGSVLGREFTEEFLATVSSLDKPTLAIALSELVRSGLLLRQGEGLQTGYAFKHALVQDAAYETLLIGKRKHLHAKAAHILEQQFPAIAEAQPELLARHYDAADIPERAVAHWQRAGTKASQASNYVEAERQLTRAIELVPRLPDDRRKNVELELQMALGTVYRATRGSGSRHTERSYARARELCEEVGNDERILEVVYGQCVSALNRPKLHDAERHAQTFMDVAERLRNEAAKLVAHRLAGSAAFLLGDFVRARDHLENCLHTDDIDPAALNQYSQGENTVMALTYLAWDLFALGCPEQAHARGAQAVSAAKGNSAFQYAKALSNGCYLHQMAGDYHAVEANMAALLDLAATKGIVVFYEIARVFQGWNRACRGDVDEGIELQQIALAKLAATEQRIDAPYLTSILAETYIRAGRIAQAQERIDEALTLARTTDERWFEAELHRLAGAIALVQGRARDAEACFNRALDVAKAQSARMWELRAATRLARLWMESGERAAAKALLLPVLNHFTEGHDLPDVMDAKAVLVGP